MYIIQLHVFVAKEILTDQLMLAFSEISVRMFYHRTQSVFPFQRQSIVFEYIPETYRWGQSWQLAIDL